MECKFLKVRLMLSLRINLGGVTMTKEVIKLSTFLSGKPTTSLGTRFSGKKLRSELEKLLEVNSKIILDFSDIEVMTQSFCDESIGVLIRQKGDKVLEKLVFRKANKAIKEVILMVKDYSLAMGKDKTLYDVLNNKK